MLRHCVFVMIALLNLSVSKSAHALEPEAVLGEYWKDPLFGEAAAEHTVRFEILHRTLWPKQASVPINQTVRVVVSNKTDQLQMLAFSDQPAELMLDPEFKLFVDEDILHAQMEPIVDGNHTHAGTDVDRPLPLVKTLDQKPSVLVKPGEFKEFLIRFSEAVEVKVFSVLHPLEGAEYFSSMDAK